MRLNYRGAENCYTFGSFRVWNSSSFTHHQVFIWFHFVWNWRIFLHCILIILSIIIIAIWKICERDCVCFKKSNVIHLNNKESCRKWYCQKWWKQWKLIWNLCKWFPIYVPDASKHINIYLQRKVLKLCWIRFLKLDQKWCVLPTDNKVINFSRFLYCFLHTKCSKMSQIYFKKPIQ